MVNKIEDSTPVLLRSLDQYTTAMVLQSMLKSAGIYCYIGDQYTNQMNTVWNQALGGIKIYVSHMDLEAAEQIAQEFEGAHPMTDKEEEVQCPRCHSKDVRSGFRTIRGWSAWVAWILAVITLTEPLAQRTGYQCTSCGKVFIRK